MIGHHKGQVSIVLLLLLIVGAASVEFALAYCHHVHGEDDHAPCNLYSALGIITLLGATSLLPDLADGPRGRPLFVRLTRLVGRLAKGWRDRSPAHRRGYLDDVKSGRP